MKLLEVAGFCWLRFKRRCPLVCSEAMVYDARADLLGINKQDIAIEIEIKRTWGDFLADFRNKKTKHTHYLDENTYAYKPSYLYYLAPTPLVGSIKGYLDGEKYPYGVIEFKGVHEFTVGHLINSLSVHRKARKLHNQKATEKLKYYTMMRMGSELASALCMSSSLHKLKNEFMDNFDLKDVEVIDEEY